MTADSKFSNWFMNGTDEKLIVSQNDEIKLFKKYYFWYLSGVFVNNLPELSGGLLSSSIFSSSEDCGFSSSFSSIRVIFILVI